MIPITWSIFMCHWKYFLYSIKLKEIRMWLLLFIQPMIDLLPWVWYTVFRFNTRFNTLWRENHKALDSTDEEPYSGIIQRVWKVFKCILKLFLSAQQEILCAFRILLTHLLKIWKKEKFFRNLIYKLCGDLRLELALIGNLSEDY